MIALLSDLTLPEWTAWAIVVALNAYVLFAGADFGGGVWDLLASGPRRAKQRSLVSNAIGPIWEANHVWLIVVVVMLFSCFPPAFSALGTVLHIPLSLMLIGIIARGSAFIFRSYSYGSRAEQRGWGRVFAVSSLITPVVLGMIVGAVVSGAVGEALASIGHGPAATLPADIDSSRAASSPMSFMDVYVRPWVSVFTLAVGAMTLALFSLLAAVYLTIEAEGDAELQDDFRRRALGAAAVAMVAALVALALDVARGGVMVRFMSLGWTRLILAGSALAAAGAVVALLRRHFKLARVAAAGWVTLILWGWVLAQFPLIIPPSLTIDAAAAPRKTLEDTIAVLAVGSVILVPSLWYLLRVFKTGPGSGVQSKR
jgi:cytochrome d ubiquinol oxidase subunit II